MTLVAVRVGAGLIALLAAAYLVHRRGAALAGLREFFLQPSAALDLGVLRAVVFAMLAWASWKSQALRVAAVPAGLRKLPWGWGWLQDRLPIDPTLAADARQLAIWASVCAALGFCTRVSAPVAALCALYLLGIPSFFGKILHENHALMMFALVLAVAPCGDALSVDRLWRRSRGEPAPVASSAYTLAIRLCWLLLGTIYLFPGLWKVWENGDLWLSGDKLRWELYGKWGQRKHLIPPFRIDLYPWLLQLLGLCTMVFEVGFIFALFRRSTRIIAAFSAVAFHVGVRLFLGIYFYELLPLVLLIDFPIFGARAQSASKQRSIWPSALAGGTLLAAQLFAGFTQVNSWPIAMHPKFSERGPQVSDVITTTQVVIEPSSGAAERDLDKPLTRAKLKNNFMRQLLELDHDMARKIPRARRSRALVRMLRDAGIVCETGDHLTLYHASWNLFPLGERSSYVRSVVGRYSVTPEGALLRETD